ncbi:MULTISPECIES: heavy metal sensor histidine kinase [Thauera]|jgi:two-component system heavy metal sensor histidine kinase CusS|uniref:Sensor protein n=1 Tax=Thauera humireducens TaxID=1134435 RepID=A0A127K4I7_9RHOO|nr:MULTISPECIES: heavy metal sensor histidine kinase [Thauera]AMO36865.1 two-component sensor histidine kinase [Thauera humireducens]ENO76486.1 two component sensor regulator [Thauera sp. 63]
MLKMPPRLSLTARLALLFALLTASLLIVVGVVLGRAVEAHFDELDTHELAGKLTLVGNLVREAGSDAGQHLDAAFAGQDTVGLLLRAADGTVLHAIQPGAFTPAHLAGAALTQGGEGWHSGPRQFIGRELAMETGGDTGDALRVAVALDISHHAHFLDEVRRGLWLGISAAALVAALLGWFAAHRGLAPLRRVTATARGLSAERLSQRLDETGAPAEVRDLVDAFNGMLERLEYSFTRLSDFSADIAHELRTPVSNLMTQTEVALSRARTNEEYREVLASNLEEFERIARMVGDMLFLAQAENGRLPRPVETVALDDDVRALIEFYEALAEERQVRMTIEGRACVTGDRLMLRRAVSNLLSNALRHTATGGTIDILIEDGIRGGNDAVTLSVCNTGDTIPPDQLPRIFDRFHRAGTNRARHGEGAGLGLAITRSIVLAHGGDIVATSADGLTRFTITLPRATDVRPPFSETTGVSP